MTKTKCGHKWLPENQVVSIVRLCELLERLGAVLPLTEEQMQIKREYVGNNHIALNTRPAE